MQSIAGEVFCFAATLAAESRHSAYIIKAPYEPEHAGERLAGKSSLSIRRYSVCKSLRHVGFRCAYRKAIAV
jgi:hypothetical protein